MKPLLFSEYRIQQALFLQSQRQKDSYLSYNTNQYVLYRYIDYLNLCGVLNDKLREKLEAIKTFKIDPNMNSYSEEITNNLNSYIDIIIENEKH